MGLLGELVELFNERFGASLTEADAAARSRRSSTTSTTSYAARIIGATMETQDETTATNFFLQKLLDDPLAREHATRLVMHSPYDRFRGEAAA